MQRLKPNTFEEVYCPVCGTLEIVKRCQKGTTSWASSLAGKECLYDEFQCPHDDKPWHNEAVKLQQEMKSITSQRVRLLFQQDLEELLTKHGCKVPESGEYLIVFDEIKQMRLNILDNGENYITIETAWRGEPTNYAIYFFDQRFYVILPDFDHEDDLKDYPTFSEAFDNPMLNRIDEYTISVTSDVYTVNEIKSMMKNIVINEKTIMINGEQVLVKNGLTNNFNS